MEKAFEEALLEMTAFALINLIIDFEKKNSVYVFILMGPLGRTFAETEGIFFLCDLKFFAKR